MSADQIATYVTVEDFQYYWQRSNERISSSYSGLHNGHYKAASFDKDLSALHAAKLSLCAKTGVPLARWGRGVTILLEKIAGNNFVHKLRAICLFEADFNWWNKLIFAKRMMKQASDCGTIPDEHFAKKGSHCNNANLCKRFFCDISRVLHWPASMQQSDFGECYDRAAHAPTSIAMQAWGTPVEAIRVLFKCLMLMQFCLKTGFGESDEFYGGTEEDPNSGLGQGNGAAPPGFSGLSTLVINAYRRMGHGAKLTSAYTARLFLLAAVMYVDDTDLLHLAPKQESTDSELIAHAQKGSTDYGLLVNASGGILKGEKCATYICSYKFPNGRAKLKELEDLPAPIGEVVRKDGTIAPAHITIPQPDGSVLPIVTLNVDEPSKMLGMHFAPIGDTTHHMEMMKKKGLDWVDRIATRPLPRRDAWLSFHAQLFPGMVWGLVAVIMRPQKLDDLIQSLYYKILPHLGVNRNITKPWRTLPERFQGLGLPNFVVVAFAAKVHFIQCNWGFKEAASELMRYAFECHLIEVGLYGNPFAWDYKTFSKLATDGSWFKNLWELGDYLGITLKLHPKYHMQPIRDRDKPLMLEFARAGFDSPQQLEALNTMRKHKNLLHLSCILCCDGRTVDQSVLAATSDKSVRHTFPIEKPTASDKALWAEAIKAITSPSLSLPVALGPFIRVPHLPYDWFTNEDKSLLFRRRVQDLEEMYDKFEPRTMDHATRFGQQYIWTMTMIGELDRSLLQFASVVHHSQDVVLLHSSAPPPQQIVEPSGFWEVLHSFENQTFWKHFDCDDDGEWIHQGLMLGSLCMVHDGSYMPEVTTEVCSAAIYIYCQHTKKRAKGCIVEHTPDADNYRAELLGGLMTQLVLRAASSRKLSPYKEASIFCDNQGVLSHGNAPWAPLSEKQPQADVIRSLKQMTRENPFPTNWKWVEGHSVEKKGWKNCNLMEKLNDIVDGIAKNALIAGYGDNDYISSIFPFEEVHIELSGKKVTGSPRKAFEQHWGYKTARAFFHKERIIDKLDFHLVWWEGVDRVMQDYPKMFRVWLTKHVSEFCGTNQQFSYWNTEKSALCPCCKDEVETTMHMTRCQSSGRKQMFKITVKVLTDWMAETHMDPILIEMVEEYLLAQGTKQMIDCLHVRHTNFELVAKVSDRLRWDCLLEGRISTIWLEVVKPLLAESGSYLSPIRWGQQFIEKLLNITHKQWIFRNSHVHYRIEGLTPVEHNKIFDKIEELMYTNPDELLPCHKHLLETDFGRLGEGSPVDRQYWIVSIESALKAAERVRSGQIVRGTMPIYNKPRRRRVIPTTRANGSIVYRRTSRRSN